MLLGLRCNATVLQPTPSFAILPHFMRHGYVVSEFLDHWTKNKPTPQAIIILSPNHFDSGIASVESIYDTIDGCYRTICHPMINPRRTKRTHVGSGFGPFVYAISDDFVVPKGSGWYIRDHGIGEHLARIHKRYPNIPLIPLILSDHNPHQTIELLKSYLLDHPNTRVIGSIDYSHYVPHNRAKIHDATTFFVTKDQHSTRDTVKNLEIDCPSCLMIIIALARSYNAEPILWFRDFSDNGRNSTSRQFWSFEKTDNQGQEKKHTMTTKRENDETDDDIFSNIDSSGFTLTRVGDTMRTRGVASKLSTPKQRNNFFRDFYQQRNPNNNLKGYRHRLLNGIDIVGMNMETALIGSGQKCNPSSGNTIRLCSDESWIPRRKDLGFNVVSVSNNHALIDSLYTRDWLKKHAMNTVGQGVGQDFFPLKKTIRGIPISIRGIDQTIIRDNIDNLCKKIATDPSVHIVSIHRGLEYQAITMAQRHTAHKLIDCGVDVIIGHHPHIVQEIEWYQGKPIAYSLGNFLFDQDIDGTQTGAMLHLIRTPTKTYARYDNRDKASVHKR
ncbi:MAG: CapA family protein [Candidatus Absconditabacterales bacterium]|nr:CapA family protein [Candidatus Absconditabacterales bacterium]